MPIFYDKVQVNKDTFRHISREVVALSSSDALKAESKKLNISIPKAMTKDYYHFLVLRNRLQSFVLIVLAWLGVIGYIFVDAIVISDVAIYSMVARFCILSLSFILTYFVYLKSDNVFHWDISMTVLVCSMALVWCYLLVITTAEFSAAFLLVGVSFLILIDLFIKTYFSIALVSNLIICAAMFYVASIKLFDCHESMMLEFSTTLFTLTACCLIICWRTIQRERNNFIRNVIDLLHTYDLNESNAILHHKAYTDELTKVPNRAAYERKSNELWQDFQDNHTLFAILVMDIDYFKVYNDTYGHIEGDSCLTMLSTRLQESLDRNGSGQLYRMGGEEFAIIIQDANALLVDSHSDTSYLQSYADLLVRTIEDMQLPHANRPDGRPYVTISIGGGYLDIDEHKSVADVYRFADNNLYRAKKTRNTAVISSVKY